MHFRTTRTKLAAGVVGALTAATTLGLGTTSASAAEVHCASFTWVQAGGSVPDGSYYLHKPSTAANSGNYNCVVTRGDHNYAVLALQETLITCYSQNIQPDMDFGPATEQAVKNAQTIINGRWNAGLSVDGRFGPVTSSWFSFKQYKQDGTHTNGCF
ncbi:peptidoglycan-binding domain-containing protein [Streptomyces sp. NPDC096934]|uniref:peptidoglycan-binding domain-containing protein n=1 Tax=Streptomyces sp. NPDC096934 TaxID=3155551 RepID=UPI0033170B9A